MTPPLWLALGSVLFIVCIAGLMKLWQLAKIEARKTDDLPENDIDVRRRINQMEELAAIARNRLRDLPRNGT